MELVTDKRKLNRGTNGKQSYIVCNSSKIYVSRNDINQGYIDVTNKYIKGYIFRYMFTNVVFRDLMSDGSSFYYNVYGVNVYVTLDELIEGHVWIGHNRKDVVVFKNADLALRALSQR